ncbi:MAG: triphosphoribosyl-dephospho-CoA synthase, partial [Negativicutes bacterium]
MSYDAGALLRQKEETENQPGKSTAEKGLLNISQYLSQAIVLEVCASPKPGMVTRFSNGSHQDMSILTFAMSSAILIKTFHDLQQTGYSFVGPPEKLLPVIRAYGIKAEHRLLQVTKGVNTQRGILFSGGILSAAAGYAAARKKMRAHLLTVVRQMTAGLVQRELKGGKKEGGTAGERLFRDCQVVGIRGEVEKGFPSVTEYGLPALKEAFARGADLNDALVHSLLSLMTVVEDSNVIWRTDLTTAQEVRDTARKILDE